MSTGNVVVIVVGAVLVVAFVLWLLLRRNDPESAAGHPEPPRTGSALLHGDVDDRPAGPGAEADGVPRRGQPGPSTDAPGDR